MRTLLPRPVTAQSRDYDAPMESSRARDAEVDDLVTTLRDYGVLTRDGLRERSGASHWTGGVFEDALRRGVERGDIKSLDGDLFEVGPDAPDLNEARHELCCSGSAPSRCPFSWPTATATAGAVELAVELHPNSTATPEKGIR
jgi:hypothetical protein